MAAVDATGRDSRIVFEASYPKGIDGMSIESERGLVYVGWPEALDVWCYTAACKGQFNHPPVANAGPDQIVDTNTNPTTLDGTGSTDADGNQLVYWWRQTAGEAVVLTDPTTAHPTFKAPSTAGVNLTFELVVSDGSASSAPDTVVVTTKQADELHLKPLLTVLPTGYGTNQLTVTFVPGDGSAASDLSSDPDTEYEWLDKPALPVLDFVPGLRAALEALKEKIKEKLTEGAVDSCVEDATDALPAPPTSQEKAAILAQCQASAPVLPFQIIDGTKMSISGSGFLSVGTAQDKAPGVQLIWARHKKSKTPSIRFSCSRGSSSRRSRCFPSRS